MPTDGRLAALRAAVAEPLSHPSADELQAAVRQIGDWAFADYFSLPERGIGRTGTPEQMHALLAADPPAVGRPFADVLKDFTDRIASFALRTNHPRFLAFVPGAPCFPAILGDWLTAAANLFAGVWLEAPAATQIECIVLDWFRQWLGMPETTRGLLTGGGSEANLTALVVARDRVPFADRARLVLYVSAQRHSSVDRAAKVMGLHPDQVRPVPIGDDLRMSGIALIRQVHADRAAGLRPWAVVANGGATNTGTVDPLAELAAVCRAEGLWFHVDAAYGWAAALTEEGRRELAGIGEADSVTLDPHKWFAQTFEAGCVLVRDGRRLPETFATRPDYMQDVVPDGAEVNFADHGIALTRRFRALKTWLSVQMLGLDWFRRLADHCCRLADYAQARLAGDQRFEITCPRQLSIVCFRYLPRDPGADVDGVNLRLVSGLLESGRGFLSSTRLRGGVTLRMCFVNWRTTAADVDELVEALAELGSRPV
jgi:aromatic-L-amino-acid/L-tryptophan decarboxylase